MALFAMMVFAATRSFIQCEDCEFRASATDLGLCLGAWLAVWSCGGFYSYFDSARRGPKAQRGGSNGSSVSVRMQLQMTELLTHEVESTGFEQIWLRQKGASPLRSLESRTCCQA